jgi:Serine aminopeptidase, S33
MGLITDVYGAAKGYEAVSLPLPPEQPSRTYEPDGAVLCRRSARPTRRAVIYPLCMNDHFVPADLASWYTDRGFHFYVADLRRGSDPGRLGQESRAAELEEYFAWLDTAAQHAHETDGIETMVLSAHAAGALIAALWCQARRASPPADALILASPSFGAGSRLVRTMAGSRFAGSARRTSALLAVARRRVRRGLDIGCPVLVLCPSGGWDAPGGTGGPLRLPVAAKGKATMRLGPHVTWLNVDGGQPGEALPDGPGQRRVFDELGRWLSAYLSGQIRDQLLL